MRRGLISEPGDNVCMVLEDVNRGDTVEVAGGVFTALDDIAPPHKMAVAVIEKGGPVRKFGGVIGRATRDIAPGEWVHTHNINSGVSAGEE